MSDNMIQISAQELFRAEDVPDDCALEGVELKKAFWRVKEMQKEAQRQQAFWKSVNDSMEGAYKKLAAFQEELRASREQLKEANERLEHNVAERTAALREQVEQIRAQRETIRALFTPIIQVWSRVLALPIVGGLDQGRVEEITQRLLEAIVQSRASFVILDLTGVKEVDAATADHLLRIGRATRLLGSICLLSGLSGAVARSLTSLDINLRDLTSFGSLESALHYALLQMGDLPRAQPARRETRS